MKQKLILQSLVMDTDIKSKLRAAKSEFLNEQLQNILIQEKNEEILLVMLQNKATTKTNITKIKDFLGIEETNEEIEIRNTKIENLNNILNNNVQLNNQYENSILLISEKISNMEIEIKSQIEIENKMKVILNNDIEEYNYLFLEDTGYSEEEDINKNIINIKEVKKSTIINTFSVNKKEDNLKGKLLERFL